MQSAHILPLTGIRFFAAAWVVLCHFRGTVVSLLPVTKPLEPAFALGYYAVPLFFLLSGFILSHNYFPRYSLKEHHRFLFLRFARLWPVHGVTLVLMLIYGGVSLSEYSGKALAEELLMMRSWFRPDLGLNYPAWSISAEWFAYICVFPLAFLALRSIRSVMLLVILLCLLLLGASDGPGETILGRGGEIFFLFLAGSTLYRIRCLVQRAPGAGIQNIGLILVLSYVVFCSILPRVVIFAGFAGLVFGLSYERGFLSRVLSTRFAVSGGLASYSLYMTHAVVGKVYGLFTAELPLQPPAIKFLLLTGLVVGVTGAAVGCYRFVEEPANRVLRRWSQRVQKPSEPRPHAQFEPAR